MFYVYERIQNGRKEFEEFNSKAESDHCYEKLLRFTRQI